MIHTFLVRLGLLHCPALVKGGETWDHTQGASNMSVVTKSAQTSRLQGDSPDVVDVGDILVHFGLVCGDENEVEDEEEEIAKSVNEERGEDEAGATHSEFCLSVQSTGHWVVWLESAGCFLHGMRIDGPPPMPNPVKTRHTVNQEMTD